MRDLQKAQSERVFNKTLVRVRLPPETSQAILVSLGVGRDSNQVNMSNSTLTSSTSGGVQLLGYFHPKDTIADLYEWIYSCMLPLPTTPCVDDSNAGMREKELIRFTFQEVFELFQSPPRTILSPYPTISLTSSNRRLEDAISPTLIESNLVPAAVVNLSWKKQGLLYYGNTPSSTAAGTGIAIGSQCFREELLYDMTIVKTISNSDKSIPIGLPLIEKVASTATSSSVGGNGEGNSNGGVSDSADGKGEGSSSKTASKPKWFKLK